MSTSKEYRRVSDSFGIRDVGSTLLDHLAKGLYPADEVLREYVQNAIDAHRIWKHETATEPEGPIQVEVRGDRLSIIDYGIGMSEIEVKRVKSIAVTNKIDSEIPLTGHKGVGIWAGLSYFETLILDTTSQGSNEGYRLTIHFKQIVDRISDRTDIGEVMEGNYVIEAYDEEEDKHCTSITLVNPIRSPEWFTAPYRVADAIRRICPCQIDPNFALYQTVMNWYAQHNIETYAIVVDGMPVYRSYPSSVEIFKPFSITINDIEVASGWQAIHKESEKLTPTHDELTGFRLIQSGFTLGGDNLYSNLKLPGYKPLNTATPTYVAWHIGEIHITSRTLRPNLQRNQLEESEEARQFVQRLRDFYLKLEEQGRAISEKRKAATKLKGDIAATLKRYKQYEDQINTILIRQAVVEFTPQDIVRIGAIHQSLVQDEQITEQSTDTRDAKKIAYLKDKEVKEARKKLITKIETFLVQAKQNRGGSTQHPNKHTMPPAANGKGNTPIVPVRNTETTTKASDDMAEEVIEDNILTPDSDVRDKLPEHSTSNANESGVDSKFVAPFSSSEDINFEKELPSEVNEEEGSNTFQEKILDSSSRKIPIAVVLGLLEQVLNEELSRSDVKAVIVDKLKERIEQVLV